MTAIQAVYIKGHEERAHPKLHTVYHIEIQASVRSWSMWRRYSEFVDLHTELIRSISEPPASLPPKHKFSILSLSPLHDDEGLLEERRSRLEVYLRAIISAKEDKWRESVAFKQFLGVPVGKQGNMGSSGAASFSSSSWLDEHLELQTRIRDIRADIDKRDALSDGGDVAASHKLNVQAKKTLGEILVRVQTLTRGLQELGVSGMMERELKGELQRRTDMIVRLQDDCEKLGNMVTVARQTSKAVGLASKVHASESDRAALLGSTSFNKPITRVFGQAQPRETAVTRPLDDQGLSQLQKQEMERQDAQVSRLATILQHQKQLGEAIGAELALHNELLDDLSANVDQVGGKLRAAKKQLNRLE